MSPYTLAQTPPKNTIQHLKNNSLIAHSAKVYSVRQNTPAASLSTQHHTPHPRRRPPVGTPLSIRLRPASVERGLHLDSFVHLPMPNNSNAPQARVIGMFCPLETIQKRIVFIEV